MEEAVKKVVREYTVHAQDVVLSSFFTVMLWISLQKIIEEAAKNYLPSLASWQLAAVEVFIASYGLWWLAKRNGGSK